MANLTIVRGGVCEASSNGTMGAADGGAICGHKHKEHKEFKIKKLKADSKGKQKEVLEKVNKGCKLCGCTAAGIY